jgi:hypothetical protein
MINEVLKPTYRRDCGTMISNNGGAHMLLTSQDSDSDSNGIARTGSICECINR